ncbi:MAG: hypothetical protein ACLGHQ_13815, partial [Acidimicrobiia bacterium]
MFAWIAGLGLAAKLSLGAGVVAVGLTGVGAAGAAGVLPGEAQTAFDDVVAVVAPVTEEEAVDDELAQDESDAEDALDEATDVDDEATEIDDEATGIDDEESGRAQEGLYRESGDTHDEAD